MPERSNDPRDPRPEERFPQLYAELRRLASRQLRRERKTASLQTSDVVHEAYLRLREQHDQQYEDWNQFRSLAAILIRRVLVDHARRRTASKRGGNWQRVGLMTLEVPAGGDGPEVLELDESLERLARLSPRQARVVELRYFAGLEIEAVAEVLGVSARTVDAEWAVARAWLARALGRKGEA